MNFGYEDGSVYRLNSVPDWNTPDDKTPADRIPVQYDARRASWTDRFSVPQQ